jgi:hypothetical protein
MPRVIKVIESCINRGEGLSKGEIKYRGGLAGHKLLEDDVVRCVTQYYTLDGEFLAEVDSRTEKIIGDFNYKEKNNK